MRRATGAVAAWMLALLLGAGSASAATDQDADGIPDAADNCPRIANPLQENSDATAAGDACQCSDVDGDGDVDLADAALTARYLAGAATSAGFEAKRCGAGGVPGCDSEDVTAVRRLLAGLEDDLPNRCEDAGTQFDPDVNNDGLVDVLDASIVGSCQGQDPATVCACREADIDVDGDIDPADVQVVSDHMDQSGFPVGPPSPGAPAVTISAPPGGTLTNQTPIGVAFSTSLPADPVTVNGIAATPVPGLPNDYTALVPLAEGQNTILVSATGSHCDVGTASLAVTLDTIPPVVQIVDPPDGASLQVVSTPVIGTVDDPTASVTLNGLPAAVVGNQWQVASLPLVLGVNPLSAVATDPVGNVGTASATVTRTLALLGLDLSPPTTRLTQPGATRPHTLIATFSDGSTQDLTLGSTGTTWQSSNDFVATVDADGVVTAVANGAITLTAAAAGLNATAQVTVEIGVDLQSLTVTPPTGVLRAAGNTLPLAASGQFSDGSTRDLTLAGSGTVWTSTDAAIAAISPDGLVTAVAPGTVVLTAANDGLSDDAQVRVVISSGLGFLRGEAYDDTLGLPLDGVTATLLADGQGPLAVPDVAQGDARGVFLLSGSDGDALVRVEKAGFTGVERRGDIPPDTAFELLDARLTPLDPAQTPIDAALGGAAVSADGRVALDVPPGSLAADASLRLTALSNQGLMGRLPAGWSPLAAVDIEPRGLVFGQPARLAVPTGASLPPGSAVAAARYDETTHGWVAAPGGVVAGQGRALELPVGASGQWVLVAPDPAPFAPPTPVPGTALAGIALGALPGDAAATGSVRPVSAPAGQGARALGTLIVTPTTGFPSGTAVLGDVTEMFDLFDLRTIVPLPFTQDLLIYRLPAKGGPADLGTDFPITPSRDFPIQLLELGMVKVDVNAPAARVGGTPVDATGGSVGEPAGGRIDIAPGALGAAYVVGLQAFGQGDLPAPLPVDLAFVGGLRVDLVGAVLASSAALSIDTPPGVSPGDQVIVARTIRDSDGMPHLQIVALGTVGTGRIDTTTVVGGLTLPGIRVGGEYLFVKPAQPLGFVAGAILVPGGGSPVSDALVRSDTASFADVTGGAGSYVVAGAAGATTNVDALDFASGDASTGAVLLASANDVALLDLTLGVVAPQVVATVPVDGAVNVLINTSVVVQFSEAIAKGSITASSVVLEQAGTPVAGQRVLSADGRTLTFLPDASLGSLLPYTLTLSSALTDAAGNPLLGFGSIAFTTIDTSKPPQPVPGQIMAGVPDPADGAVLVTGAQGTAEPGSGVTLTNLRTQQTITVLADGDGGFRLRLGAVIGDRLGLTFRNAAGQKVDFPITQFEDPDGTVGLGIAGGTIPGPAGQTGHVLARALRVPGTFRLQGGVAPGTLPVLPADLSYLDFFELVVADAEFQTLSDLRLTESQDRFPPASALLAPFEAMGSLSVPANFLVNGLLRFRGEVTDGAGNTRRVEGTTQVVSAAPDTTPLESAFDSAFPTLFVTSPAEALLNQQVDVSAIAPSARVDLEVPEPAGLDPSFPLLLVRVVSVGGTARLSVVDRLRRDTSSTGAPVLVTVGRELPGASLPGTYAVLASSQPLAFVTGELSGSAAAVSVTGSPLVFETSGPNARFNAPVVAGGAFALDFVDPASGAVSGSTSGTAPASGAVDVGSPLGPVAGTLSVSGFPDRGASVDQRQPITLRFSESVDLRTVTPSTVTVTDSRGVRVFGSLAGSPDGRVVTFTPARRWAFGESYTYAVGTSVVARSGARLSATFAQGFDTFAPVVYGSTPLDVARDVAVAGNTALVGGDAGLNVVDVTVADRPLALGLIPAPGGVTGVALLGGASFNDRNGQAVTGTLGLAVSGNAADPGRLSVFDLNTPASPVLLGATQLTVPSGQTPPAGVPDSPGVPSAIAFGPNQTAVVAVQTVGVESVDLTQAIPDDPTNPGGALGPRFPMVAFETANQIAALNGNLLVAGQNGLTILNSATLDPVANASTTGNALGVDGLLGFRIDNDGDGRFATPGEVFDLAAVANGSDGTLQLFDLLDPSDPLLVSVVRIPHPVLDVKLDPNENLAYVACGTDGIAIVDLDGPSGIQPIDRNGDGRDDRLLGLVDTGGSAERLALGLDRGVGYVADGSVGLTVVQLLPPRTAITEVLRDPVAGTTGDERSILTTGEGLLSDEGLAVEVSAVVPPRQNLSLVIDETPDPGGSPLLSFVGGGTSASLHSGANSFAIGIARAPGHPGSRASLSVTDGAGAVVERFDLRLRAAAAPTAALETLFVAPDPALIPDDQSSLQLSVGGLFADGSVRNLTAAADGTTYETSKPTVASVGPDGRVDAVAGGITLVRVANGGVETSHAVRIDRAPELDLLTVTTPFVTLVNAGQQFPLGVIGVLTDGGRADFSSAFGTSYLSSDPAVVTVDNTGTLTAIANGSARIDIQNGPQQASALVAVELRTAPTITGIDLAPFVGSVSADDAEVSAEATVSGTGSLEGLVVSFALSGGGTVSATTDRAGTARGLLRNLTTPGVQTVTASFAMFSDGEPLTVVAGTADTEPNDSVAAAPPLRVGRGLVGTLDGTTDTADVFAVSFNTGGTLGLAVALGTSVVLGDVTISVLDAGGGVLAQVTPTALRTELSQALVPGASFIRIASAGSAVDYSVETSFEQEPVTVASVSPAGGPAGTPVTIMGTGFSAVPAENLVSFGAVQAGVTAASPTRLDVVVPVNAVDGGNLRVVVRGREALGAVFDTGNPGPLPMATLTPPAADMVRLDPVSGMLLVANRLLVQFDPGVARPQVDGLAASVGATVVGFLPLHNTYELELGTTTLAALDATWLQLQASPGVDLVSPSAFETVARAIDIDTRDRAPDLPWPPSPPYPRVFGEASYEVIRAMAGAAVIRAHPDFDDPNDYKPAKVAVIDTGFDPLRANEFRDQNATNVVQLFDWQDPNGGVAPVPFPSAYKDLDGHGTEVMSTIAAVNNGVDFSGVVGSLFPKDRSPLTRVQYVVYRTTFFDAANNVFHAIHVPAVWAALEDIDRQNASVGSGFAFDVVNMSFGSLAQPGTPAFHGAQGAYYQRLNPLAGRTLVTLSAGNEGVSTALSPLASAAALTSHVLSVGATAVANADGTGEQQDFRAIFSPDTGSRVAKLKEFGLADANNMLLVDPNTYFCDGNGQVGSNCSDGVEIAAPGEDVLAASRFCTNLGITTSPADCTADELANGSTSGLSSFRGTSAAAPLVAGAATVLQMIRPQAGFLTPQQLKTLLIDNGDNVIGKWGANDRLITKPRLPRLNLLRSVLAVLPPAGFVPAYVADQETDNGAGLPRGSIVALNLDRLTCKRPPAGEDRVVQTFRAGQFNTGRPTTVRVSPLGNELWAVVENVDPQIGDGLLVADTESLQPDEFIPFSKLPGATGPIRLATNKPGLAFSKDGLLLYVAVNRQIGILNVGERKFVGSFQDLPKPFRNGILNATTVGNLAVRKGTLELLAMTPFPNPGDPSQVVTPQFFSDLRMSGDGEILYAVVESGTGGGDQPGHVVPINVNLYKDVRLREPGLQSDLTEYFKRVPRPAGAPIFFDMEGIGLTQRGFTTGDEPKEVATFFDPDSPLGDQYTYVVHGGANAFVGVSPDLAAFNNLIALSEIEINGYKPPGAASPIARIPGELSALLNSGQTVLNAPGLIGVFELNNVVPTQVMPSSVVFAWGERTTPMTFPTPLPGDLVYAKRPYAIALTGDALNLGLVGFYQTGNFGVLTDVNIPGTGKLQDQFTNQAALPPFASLPDRSFKAIAGVTPAIDLDNHIWPRRGRLRTFGATVPSPDEARLFTYDVEIGGEGECAIASHAGTGYPGPVTVTLPDFENNQLGSGDALVRLGWMTSGATATDLKGNTFGPGDSVTFQRGGGSVSVIDIDALRTRLQVDAPATVNVLGVLAPKLQRDALCDDFVPRLDAVLGEEQLTCSHEVVTHHLYYKPQGASSPQRFTRPRGVDYQPTLVVESPRFGHHITDRDSVEFRWRDPRITSLLIEIDDLDVPDPNDPDSGSFVAVAAVALTPQERARGSIKREWRQLVSSGTPLVDKHRYLVQVHGVAAGSFTNTYMIYRYETTVGPSTGSRLVSIRIDPDPITVKVGERASAHAIGSFDDGIDRDITSTSSWTIANPMVATVNPAAEVTGKSGGTTLVRASRDGITGQGAVDVIPITSIDVTPIAPVINQGFGQQFQATANYADGDMVDITADANWVSSSPGLIPIGSATNPAVPLAPGLASGIFAGVADITASQGSVTSNVATLTVQAAGFQAIFNEVVEAPVRDWNDSGFGGDGTPFNATPGVDPGAVDLSDQWVELLNTGAMVDLSGWTLQFDNVAGLTTTLGLSGMLPINGVAVFPVPGLKADGVLFLRDNGMVLKDALDLAALRGSLGVATGECDEALARLPIGFQRRAASIGAPNGSTATLVGIDVTPASASVGVKSSLGYTATGSFDDASMADITPQVRWISSDPNTALFTGGGVVHGLVSGAVQVTASDGCSITSPPENLTVTATGTPVVINEVIELPQTDWNDTVGGNGVVCDGVPGTGAVTLLDQCIELLNTGPPVDLTGWVVQVVPSVPPPPPLPASFTIPIVPPTVPTPTGATVSFGNGGTPIPIGSVLNLRDASSAIIDVIDLSGRPIGTSPLNESLSRIPNGIDDLTLPGQLQRRPATLGATNPLH